MWMELYRRVWRVQATLKSKHGDNKFDELLKSISGCLIHIYYAEDGNKEGLLKVNNAYIGSSPHPESNDLYREYYGTGAPIIGMDCISDKSKFDWNGFTEFLKACKAITGPYLIDRDIRTKRDYMGNAEIHEDDFITPYRTQYRSNNRYKDNNDMFAQLIREGVYKHYEYDGGPEGDFVIQELRHKTLNNYSYSLLKMDKRSAFLGLHLARLWEKRGTSKI
jgi:hypothetical protein